MKWLNPLEFVPNLTSLSNLDSVLFRTLPFDWSDSSFTRADPNEDSIRPFPDSPRKQPRRCYERRYILKRGWLGTFLLEAQAPVRAGFFLASTCCDVITCTRSRNNRICNGNILRSRVHLHPDAREYCTMLRKDGTVHWSCQNFPDGGFFCSNLQVHKNVGNFFSSVRIQSERMRPAL